MTVTTPVRARVARLAASLGLALVVTLVPAGGALAYSTSSTGAYAFVGTPVTDLGGTALSPALVTRPRTIKEVAAYANYDQYVTVTTNLWAIVPTPNSKGYPYWAKTRTTTRTGWISAAQTSIDDNGTTFGSGSLATYVGYSATVTVKWQLSNGYVIGTRTIDYDARTDYRILNANWVTGTTTWGGGAFAMYTS